MAELLKIFKITELPERRLRQVDPDLTTLNKSSIDDEDIIQNNDNEVRKNVLNLKKALR